MKVNSPYYVKLFLITYSFIRCWWTDLWYLDLAKFFSLDFLGILFHWGVSDLVFDETADLLFHWGVSDFVFDETADLKFQWGASDLAFGEIASLSSCFHLAIWGILWAIRFIEIHFDMLFYFHDDSWDFDDFILGSCLFLSLAISIIFMDFCACPSLVIWTISNLTLILVNLHTHASDRLSIFLFSIF